MTKEKTVLKQSGKSSGELALRKTSSRLKALQELGSGKITHPGAGVALALEKGGAILWDKPANTYRITKVGEELLIQWAGAIDLVVRRFGATVEYGHAGDSEYCTLAIRAGLPAPLVELGNAVQNCSDLTPQQMLEFALASPELALATWREVYLASMSPQ